MSEPIDPADDVRIPTWLGGGLALLVVIGVVAGLGGWRAAVDGWPYRVASAVHYGCALGYAGAAALDFAEHVRLERAATGKWWTWVAIPLGESVNHIFTLAIVIGTLTLARPMHGHVTSWRDWLVLLSPALFLASGWHDEIRYHRHRTRQRENILHTVGHLGGGAMLFSFAMLRFIPWEQL